MNYHYRFRRLYKSVTNKLVDHLPQEMIEIEQFGP